jgi:hypothetical protein
MAWHLHASKQIEVREGDWDVGTAIQVIAGDTLIFQAWGQIWAGVWFTGNNGPRGWDNRDNNNKFPLPGAHPYQLLGKLDSGYFEIGDSHRIDQTPDQGELYLRINDDLPSNGNGAFQCMVQVYRNG